MSNFHQTIIVGHLGKDPEERAMPNGKAVANFSVAVTERWKNKDGDEQERTEWYNCAAFGRTAEIATEYLQKGSLVMVTGRMQTDKYEDKEGVTRYSVKLVVDKLVLMPRKGASEDDGDQRRSRGASQSRQREAPAAAESFDDDIPF